ncbi:MAG: CRISPR-associated protein Cas4 [Anaeromicrobium sp.]|jgi:CRISPR-associated protein Cas1|uniref:CRISPR-associated protein Cas4 n=1 Tax=Anaeromicrobium sp. TaxID=1929132 RepID=UPI0025E1D944|nr:CRISPR-associated protein Cas4 [Anaeromicrobium sp.]MCT4593242.1 CRISPR-associated protein Cas4 [Anaeromicrobium sp.]
MERIRIPISAIGEILYCPRNFYYRVMEKANDYNHHVLKGKIEENKRNEKEKLKTRERSKIRNVYLESEEYNMVGVLDEIEEKDGQYYPVEYKKGKKQNNINDHVQLCCQALLIEANMNVSLEKGYIYYSSSYEKGEVYFTEELRELTINAIENANKIIEEEIIPPPINDNRCEGKIKK